MKAYLSVFRIRFINSLQYRVALLGEIAARLLWSIMEILALYAFYRADPAAFPMALAQTASYIWLQQTLIPLFSVVYADGAIYAAIEEGSIAYDLVRPVGLYGRWFCQSAANRLAVTALSTAPALLIALCIPAPYGLSLPPGVGTLLLFVISVALALGVVVAFAMLMYASLFYTLSHRGVRIIVTAVTSFLSGGVIPLPFFPAPVLAVIELLPFAAMQNMPLRIYSGNIGGIDAIWGVAFQLAWLAALVGIGRLSMRRAIRKVIVQGG